MSNRLFGRGLEGAVRDVVNFTTGTFKARALDRANNTSTILKAITGITNASPMVVTITSHGWSNGDIVVINGVGGITAANGTWVIASVATNTFALTTLFAEGGSALNSTGNAAYTSGGKAINLSVSSASTDLPSGAGSSTDYTLTLNTSSPGNGYVDSDDPSWASVSASTNIDAIAMLQTAATDRNVYFYDGKIFVRVAADALISATTLWVEPLYGPLASGASFVLSNGVTATLTAPAAAGARSLTVSALSAAVAAGHTGDATLTVSSSSLPLVTGSGAPSTVNFTVAANGWFKV
jgi:hypothetical protein